MKRLLATAAALLLAAPVGAAEILVPTDQATIQAAFAAAAAGDTITIEAGTYLESVDVTENGGGAAEDHLVRSADANPDSVIWTPSGTADDTDNMCVDFGFPYTGTLTFQNITFAGDPDSNHVGIDWTTANDNLALDGVSFKDLRHSVYRSAGGSSVFLSMVGVEMSSPQSTREDAFSHFRLANIDSTYVNGCLFDVTGVGTPQWSSVIRTIDISNVTILNSTFVASTSGDDLSNGFLKLDGTTSDVLIDGCVFSGNDVSYSQLSVGDDLTTDQIQGLTVRGCEFVDGGIGVDIRNGTTTAAGEMHRDIAIYGCGFTSTGGSTSSDSQFGIKANGLNGGLFIGNRLYNFERFAGISLRSCRHVIVSGNEFHNCDNGIAIPGSSVLDCGNQYACSIVGNYFLNGGGDGAIKVDNYDEVAAAAAPNDTLLSIGGNFFENVADVGAWVDTSNVQQDWPTVAEWVAEMEGESSLMVLQGDGSAELPTGIAAAKAARIVPVAEASGYTPWGRVRQ